MIDYTEQELNELFERSKNDHAIIVGSEVRVLIGMIRRATPLSSNGAESDIARSIETIENAYNFVSDAGPLKSCGEWKYLKRLVSAPPQPAPDAMREALIKTRNWLAIQFNEKIDNTKLAQVIGDINDVLSNHKDSSS